jgi:hypothetical protein
MARRMASPGTSGSGGRGPPARSRVVDRHNPGIAWLRGTSGDSVGNGDVSVQSATVPTLRRRAASDPAYCRTNLRAVRYLPVPLNCPVGLGPLRFPTPSPLVGQGWGGGPVATIQARLVSPRSDNPSPQPSPTRGEGIINTSALLVCWWFSGIGFKPRPAGLSSCRFTSFRAGRARPS